MAGVPIVYRDVRERTLASYNYVDIASGTGIVDFQAIATENDEGIAYRLTTHPYTSEPSHIAWDTPMGTTNFTIDSSPFNLPRTMKGTLTVAFLQAVWTRLHDGARTYNTIEFFHYDGTTETSLAASQTGPETGGANDQEVYYDNVVMDFDIPLTNFKKGDILRMKIAQWGSDNDAGYAVGLDPLSRDISWFGKTVEAANHPTWFKVAVPFRIDL